MKKKNSEPEFFLKSVIYLFERQNERETEYESIFYSLVLWSNACIKWLQQHKLCQAETRNPWSLPYGQSSAASQVRWQEIGSEAEAGLHPRHSDMECRAFQEVV